MFALLAATIDAFHALAMVLWIVGLPLLFARKHPRLRRAFAAYAIAFALLSQLSRFVLGECFLTTLVRSVWAHAGAVTNDEWFTVRASKAIFGVAPSHRAVSIVSELLVVATAASVFVSLRRDRRPTQALRAEMGKTVEGASSHP